MVKRRARLEKGRKEGVPNLTLIVADMIGLEMVNSHACSRASAGLAGKLGTGLRTVPRRPRRAAMDNRRGNRLQRKCVNPHMAVQRHLMVERNLGRGQRRASDPKLERRCRALRVPTELA